MCEVSFEVPDELRQLAGDLSPPELAALAREALLVRLYAVGKLSSGRGAELLGLSRRAFLELAEQYGVSAWDEPDDLKMEAIRASAGP